MAKAGFCTLLPFDYSRIFCYLQFRLFVGGSIKPTLHQLCVTFVNHVMERGFYSIVNVCLCAYCLSAFCGECFKLLGNVYIHNQRVNMSQLGESDKESSNQSHKNCVLHYCAYGCVCVIALKASVSGLVTNVVILFAV